MAVSSIYQFTRKAVLIIGIGLLAACSQKAETLKITVTQFGSATEDAFDAYGTAQTAQFAPTPKSQNARQSEFITNMEAFTGKVTPSNLPTLLDPDAVKIDPNVAQQWQKTLADLRSQYRQFVAIFDQIEGGSALGASAVTDSGPILEKLRSQLDAITSDLAKDPPQYLVRRGTLIAELNKIRSEPNDDNDAKSLRLQIWWQDWQALMAEEKLLQTHTLRSFMTASSLGAHLQNQIDSYAKLDVTALIGAAEQGIALAGEVRNLPPAELVAQGSNLLETATGSATAIPAQ
jgi:hypothetical protein